ncbi:hypothetical protein [Lysobacter claricitrinus]|uniref:hypothetical protein n=1 Tax=Lysobacter claricitrinus TaxID=3367728 RepID=UPI0037DAFEDE
MTRFSPRTLIVTGVLVLAVATVFELLLADRVPDFFRGLLFGIGAAMCFAGVLRSRMPDPCDASTPALRKRYVREFTPPMVGYVVTLMGSVWLLKTISDPALRAVVALAPVPFVALTMRAVIRYIRDTDELQRRIEIEAVSMATALVSLGYFAAGLLQSAKVIDIPSSAAMIWVFPLICLVYGLAKVVIARRFA